MKKKKKKQPWEIVLKDRFLTNEKPDNPYMVTLLYFVVFFLSFLLVFVCFFQLCEVQKTSMLNTLHEGDNVLLLRSSSTYKRGDIVVITKLDEHGNPMNIIKRVIATGGDTLRFSENTETGVVQMYLKKKGDDEFSPVTEKYIYEPMTKAGFTDTYDGFAFDSDIEIEKGFIFAMGDNRNNSSDSRAEGAYPVTSVYAKSVLIVKKDSILEWLLKLLYHENNTANGFAAA